MTAFVHLERGNPEGARIKFRKAREQLSPLLTHYLGVDVAQIVERIDQALTALEGVARGESNLLALVPPFAMHLDRRRVRGDEVEWQEFLEPQSSQEESWRRRRRPRGRDSQGQGARRMGTAQSDQGGRADG